MWRLYRIIDFFKYLPKEIKWFCQRGKRGYSDMDVYSIDDWFLTVIVPMLRQLKETKHGYPSDLTPEQWDKILDRMIFCFKEVNDDTCSMVNEYSGKLFSFITNDEETNKADKELKDKFFKREIEIDEYKTKMKNEGFQLFSKYFHNLWD